MDLPSDASGKPIAANDNDNHIYLLIDNRLVKAFGGKYSVDIRQKAGKYYEVTIDKAIIPKPGNHTFKILQPDFGYTGNNFNITLT
jgi:hypothetical protein